MRTILCNKNWEKIILNTTLYSEFLDNKKWFIKIILNTKNNYIIVLLCRIFQSNIILSKKFFKNKNPV